MKEHKTNAARLLDKAKIYYKLIPYEVDESDLSAVHVAAELEEPVNRLFKTLVLKGDKSGYFICIIPGDQELNLKLAAKVSDNKNCQMIPMKDLLNVTGYIRGACSPIAMKKKFPTYIDNSCADFDFIYISAGIRGLQIQINSSDLINLIDAQAVQLTNK